MSRCFPYPPPGYSLSRASNEALIESIKLQKERQQAKEQSKKEKEKEKRKEKKEKRKEKRKERKEKTNQNLDKSDKVLKGHAGEKYWAGTESVFLHKGRATETERLENSSLTEEHEQPICLQVPSSSSDSTENSNKRKRLSLPIDGSCGHGNIIKIRLSSKKKSECDTSVNEHPCSTSGRTDFPAQTKDEISPGVTRQNLCCKSDGTSNIGQGFPLSTDKEWICSTSGQIDTAAPGKAPSRPNVVITSMQRLGLQYKNLVENWLPPQLQNTCLDLDDQEWLFHGKNQDVRPEKRFRSGDYSISCSRSLALWPHVQYLHEADVYALPFTVPF